MGLQGFRNFIFYHFILYQPQTYSIPKKPNSEVIKLIHASYDYIVKEYHDGQWYLVTYSEDGAKISEIPIDF